jgi:tRNA(fMet)-specific endonuclease VapC
VITHLLDTDTFSEYLRERLYKPGEAPITDRVIAAKPNSIGISVVTISEMMKGLLNLLQRFEKSGRTEIGFNEMLRVYEAWQLFPIQSYDAMAEAQFVNLSAAVRRLGRPDCQIAAIALANNLVVVTRNIRHFSQIPDVVYEDWTHPMGA